MPHTTPKTDTVEITMPTKLPVASDVVPVPTVRSPDVTVV